MYKRILFSCFFIGLLFWVVTACDSDYNELGADVIGDESFEVGEPETFTVKAYNQDYGPIETSDLPVNALGIYKNPVFGETKASLAVQVQLANVNPTFDESLHPEIDSVVLYVPYFSTRKEIKTDGSSIYELDSIYGSYHDKIKLKVYESGYFIQNIDPSSTTGELMRYYNNQRSEFDSRKITLLNTSSDTSENDAFFFSENEIKDDKTDSEGNTTTTRRAPGMRLFLNNDFFKNKIFEAPSGKLLNNSVFKEYFRGLYFSVEPSGTSDGNLAMINIKGGNITIYYHQLEAAVSDTNPTPDTENKTLVLNLNGRSVNFLEYQNTATPPESGMIYLKGGQGSMGIIELFGADANGNAPELNDLRDKKWLVNDASLTFTINRNLMSSATDEPNRIYLYDLTNKRPIADYYSDQSTSSKPKYAKSTYGGIIKKQNGQGYQYKIRLTNYIRSLLKHRDSTNVKLGLVISETIADVSNKKLKDEISIFDQSKIKYIPTSSVMSPLGTILYGTDAVINEEDKIKFKIYFTKPKQN